jgi:hypothetical protein
MYPEYSDAKIILGGEAYAAKYIVSIGYYAHHYNWLQFSNELPNDIVHVNIIHLLIGDPLISPIK